ncbi:MULTISPECIES: gephyrin-like molybdotransferase Glp [unclassified Niallia]|uniref:molybdopterin molybdotransferase MoeA n=1 Tax=unclassified Niallia TaxID=2837522 RepID=UPI001EDC6688|nr:MULTISPECIES: gephyrin-like molybdotransferase Glp [unclassified Niallia]MDL0434610.1 molybdopterin molybdotransferase MoeA [Niallia sp. SS-2023]UPO88424.1 molybdopterin molybdotransferase MoeA [Niallia sp. Man26]
MVERRTPIAVEEAVKKVMDCKLAGKTEYVSIFDSSDRFLAEDIKADHDIPRFDRSAYDGYAFLSKASACCTEENPLILEVIDEIGAGYVCKKNIGKNEAVRIMTGAMLPKDCDAVVMLEDVAESSVDGKPYITVTKQVQMGENISFKGEDVQEGEVLVQKGTKINPGIVALLATFGYEQVPVAKKPKIGVFATGSELLEVNEPLEEGKIRNSNAYMVMAQIKQAGAEAVYFGKLADILEDSYEAIKESLNAVDILVTTGGVSVGDFDLLPVIYQKLGAEVLFNKIAMRPGSVTTVASLDGKLLFGLSGNPSACFVGFELFARPIVRTMLFAEKPHLPTATAILTADFLTSNAFTRFIRSRTFLDEDVLYTGPSGTDKSNIVSSLSHANALTVLPGGQTGYKAGDRVQVIMLEGNIN